MVLFLLKIVAKVALNAAALYGLTRLFDGLVVAGDWRAFLLGGFVVAVVMSVLRPILKVLTFPLLLLTFGVFNIVINVVILLVADYFLAELTVTGFWTHVWGAVILGILNSII